MTQASNRTGETKRELLEDDLALGPDRDAGQRGNISASNRIVEGRRELLLEQSHGSPERSGLENKEFDMM